MKKTLSVILILLICFSTLISASAATVSLNSQSISLFKGDKVTLKINGIKSSNVTWKSSNKKIVTVTKSGVITAKAPGTATITGKYKTITFRCKVTVQNVKKLNTLLYSGEYGRLYLKEINSKGFIIKYQNTTKMDIWLDSMYFVLDGKQLEYADSGKSDPDTGFLIIYNTVDMIVPKGWSKDYLMYIKNPSVNSKRLSGFLRVMEYANSKGKDIGQIVFKDIKIQ